MDNPNPWPRVPVSATVLPARVSGPRVGVRPLASWGACLTDGAGVFSDERIALGHRRLSIIDLSDAASQPFASKDGSLQLVFNVETSDTGTTHGTALKERRDITNWKKIGTITFDAAVASFNGDHVFHVNHPAWREDRNDPRTVVRK